MDATSETRVVASQEIIYQCPQCGSSQASALRLKHIGKLYGIIPVMVTGENVVVCDGCGYESRALVTPEEFTAIPEAQWNDYIRPKITFMQKFCIVLSILFFFAAIVSLPAAIYGLIAVKGRSRGGRRPPSSASCSHCWAR